MLISIYFQIKFQFSLQQDNTAEYYLKNTGILTHQDLLEQYGASGEDANNMLEDKGKLLLDYPLSCWLLPGLYITNGLLPNQRNCVTELTTLQNPYILEIKFTLI